MPRATCCVFVLWRSFINKWQVCNETYDVPIFVCLQLVCDAEIIERFTANLQLPPKDWTSSVFMTVFAADLLIVFPLCKNLYWNYGVQYFRGISAVTAYSLWSKELICVISKLWLNVKVSVFLLSEFCHFPSFRFFLFLSVAKQTFHVCSFKMPLSPNCC